MSPNLKLPILRARVASHEIGLLWRGNELAEILSPGVHYIPRWNDPVAIETLSTRDILVRSRANSQIVITSGKLGAHAEEIVLGDSERAIIWAEGRMRVLLGPGLHAVWTATRGLRIERLDATAARLEHPQLKAILALPGVATLIETQEVPPWSAGLWWKNGEYQGRLAPGLHGWWKDIALIQVKNVDLREQTLDISGQEILTADHVTLRLNALVTYRVEDPLASVTRSTDAGLALYKAAQLALRVAVGGRELDALLAAKDVLAEELLAAIRPRAAELGLALGSVGVRDLILPGEMKTLLNRVVEARKAAEAALITRREETASIRMQANTAKVYESNPALMRLRELEAIENIAGKASLSIVLGEKGVAERVVKML